jgi:hypothetical protein
VLELPGSRTTVLAYLASLTTNRSWYAGIRDGRVIWTHVSDGWLDRMAGQAISQAKKEP